MLQIVDEGEFVSLSNPTDFIGAMAIQMMSLRVEPYYANKQDWHLKS